MSIMVRVEDGSRGKGSGGGAADVSLLPVPLRVRSWPDGDELALMPRKDTSRAWALACLSFAARVEAMHQGSGAPFRSKAPKVTTQTKMATRVVGSFRQFPRPPRPDPAPCTHALFAVS